MFGSWVRIAAWLVAAVLVPVLTFALAGWIGSSIPRNADWEEPEDGVTIMVGSNGVHTEIAMPVATPEWDWHAYFPVTDLAATQRPYTHIAVSWGEQAFFLETPTWADLDPIVAARALVGGDPVLHVAHYVRPARADDYRDLTLRPEEYRALAETIAAQLSPDHEREVMPGYNKHDVFYTARGTYHLGNTCNQWTSDQLATAGVETGRWTPFPGGVMKWVERREAD